MHSVKHIIKRLVREDGGAAASEYAILVAFIAALIAVAVSKFDLGNTFAVAAGKVQTLIGTAPTTP